MTEAHPSTSITGLVLAGGRGQRMGGLDKGLVPLNGRPMVSYVLEALTEQVAAVLINANRSVEKYEALGHKVITDSSSDFLGPLAGVEAGLRSATTDFVVSAPCDSPLIEPVLVPRLYTGLQDDGADIAVAHDGERMHPVFLLVRRSLQPSVAQFLADGERKIVLWFERHRTVTVDFSDQPQMFLNVNRDAERVEVEAKLVARAGHV